MEDQMQAQEMHAGEADGNQRQSRDMSNWSAGANNFARQRTTTEIKRINALNLEPASPATVGDKRSDRIRPKQQAGWPAGGKGSGPRDTNMKEDFRKSLETFQNWEAKKNQAAGGAAGGESGRRMSGNAKEFVPGGSTPGVTPANGSGGENKPTGPQPEFSLKQETSSRMPLGKVLENYYDKARSAVASKQLPSWPQTLAGTSFHDVLGRPDPTKTITLPPGQQPQMQQQPNQWQQPPNPNQPAMQQQAPMQGMPQGQMPGVMFNPQGGQAPQGGGNNQPPMGYPQMYMTPQGAVPMGQMPQQPGGRGGQMPQQQPQQGQGMQQPPQGQGMQQPMGMMMPGQGGMMMMPGQGGMGQMGQPPQQSGMGGMMMTGPGGMGGQPGGNMGGPVMNIGGQQMMMMPVMMAGGGGGYPGQGQGQGGYQQGYMQPGMPGNMPGGGDQHQM